MHKFLMVACVLFGFASGARADDEFECGTDCGAECFENLPGITARVRQENCKNSCIADQQRNACFNEAQQTHPHAHGHSESTDEERPIEEPRRERERPRAKGR